MTKGRFSVFAILSVFISLFIIGKCDIVCKQHGAVINVPENKKKPFVVFTPDCTDTLGGTVSYIMTDGRPKLIYFKKFELNGANKVIVIGKLNADFIHKFRLYITVSSTSASRDEMIELAISLENVNDNKPNIRDVPDVLNVYENEAIGKIINSCRANDKDKDAVIFSLKASADASKWFLDQTTCDLYVKTKLDFETQQKYTLVIEAVDQGSPKKTAAPRTTTVNIIDVNDNYPVCPKYFKVVSIQEDFATGTKIDGIVCSDADSGNNGAVTYSLTAGNDNNVHNKFSMNPTTGDLSLNNPVDYETLNTYTVKVDVADGGNPSLTSTVIFSIIVTDVDDNVPTWPTNPVLMSVGETTSIGTIVFTLTADDDDQPNTAASNIKYELQTPPTPDWFKVDKDTGAVSVTSTMSRTIKPWVTLDVIAYSTNKTLGTNQVTVNITLLDENNVAPSFKQVFYQGNITENDQVDTFIFTVSATDPEEGVNGQVEYNLNSSIFKVDPTSGNVSLNSAVNFELNSVFSLKIEARDLGNPVLSGFASLLINVLPVNEFTPVITTPTVPVHVLEDTEPGSDLFDVDATDPDAGPDGKVTFLIDNVLSPFSIEPDTGVFRVSRTLDRESNSTWEIVIVATDNSKSTPKNSSVTVTIIVDDVNDNTPLCEPLSNTIVSLPHTLNQPLATISCTDRDEGTNAEFTYTKLSGDTKSEFDVDSSNGEVKLVKPPTETTYTLTIEIKDKGNPVLKMSIAYNIRVELSFTFGTFPTPIMISEDTAPNSVIHSFSACCVFGIVRYELISGNEDGSVLLDPSSGKLILRKGLDFESKSTFRYEIRATALKTNTMTKEFVDLQVTDSNDNPPKFDNSFQTYDLSEDADTSVVIAQLTASDPDSGINGELVYTLTGGNVFMVDDSGNLMLTSSLDAESTTQYTLIITATDKGTIPLSGFTTVVINVLNVNEFAPEIVDVVNGIVVANISEGAALGSPIFKLKATDSDVNTQFTYNILQGNDGQSFIMDTSSGDIYLAKLLNRENKSQYNLTIEVTNTDDDKVSAIVIINVLDINDNDPKFSQDVYQLDVTHDDPADKLITTFIITDDDIGTNQDIVSVAITDGDPNNHFKIVDYKILTNTQVNYKTDQLYTLSLTVVDGGFPQRSGDTRVTIRVLPNYKPPRFISSSYSASVREDSTPSDAVFDMDATADGGTEGNTGTIAYTIKSGNEDNDFSISETTGVIHITSLIDFETKEEYVLMIEAKSKEDTSLLTVATLTVSVTNLNDHYPIFTQSLYDMNIGEDANTMDVVGNVLASDLDKTPHGTVVYSFGPATGSSDFSIDNTGAIKVDKPLNYINQIVYSIPIIASDGSLQTNSLVVIRVNDVNNKVPIFNPDTLTVDVVESMGIGQAFYTVKADDLDTGINGELIYTIVSGNYNDQLSLNPSSGSLTVASSLDRETHDRFELLIRAEDKAINGRLSGTLSLTVNVDDANDHNPTFTNPFQEVILKRDTIPGTNFLNVSATDNDNGENAKLVYEISDGNNAGLFLIDVFSGQIKTATDVENADNEYTLVITSKDKGIPHRDGSMTVKLQITPLKTSLISDQVLQVFEETPPGESPGSVTPGHTATPAITYSIVSGNYKNSFEINEKSGQLYTLRKLDRENYPTYLLTVRIVDAGSVDQTKLVTIDVLDINDNDPIITSMDTTINVVENTPVGQSVASLNLKDADDGINGEVDLVIASTPIAASIYFETDQNMLKIKKILDYETITGVTFKIFAVDRGLVKRTSTIEVVVNVINVDDDIVYSEEGKVPSIYISTETSSNADNGEVVIALDASNFNINSSFGQVTYKSPNREGIFSVAASGVVTVQKKELLEPESKYFVWIVASANILSEKKDILGLLRIDTFDPNKHLVSLESSLDVATLDGYRNELELNLKTTYFPSDQPKIYKIQEFGASTRRRLLAASSETLVYVIEGSPSTEISDVETLKSFRSMNVMLNSLRLNPDKDTPKSQVSTANFPVSAVNGHSEPVTTSPEEAEPGFLASTEGYVTLTMICLLVIIIIIIFVVFIYKKKKRSKESMNESAEELMPEEPVKLQRKIDITKPTGLGKPKDVLPTIIAPGKPSLVASTLLVPSKKGSTSISPKKQLTPISPIHSSASASEITITDGKQSKLPEKKLLPTTEKNFGKKASTIDPVSGIPSDGSNDNKPVVIKRNNGPVVHRGKEYDGVGFNKDTKQRYAYNTRTGSTLWEEKDKGLGSGGQAAGPVKKKSMAPKLTVVGEAPGSNVPNLILNRSIGVVSSDK